MLLALANEPSFFLLTRIPADFAIRNRVSKSLGTSDIFVGKAIGASAGAGAGAGADDGAVDGAFAFAFRPLGATALAVSAFCLPRGAGAERERADGGGGWTEPLGVEGAKA